MKQKNSINAPKSASANASEGVTKIAAPRKPKTRKDRKPSRLLWPLRLLPRNFPTMVDIASPAERTAIIAHAGFMGRKRIGGIIPNPYKIAPLKGKFIMSSSLSKWKTRWSNNRKSPIVLGKVKRKTNAIRSGTRINLPINGYNK